MTLSRPLNIIAVVGYRRKDEGFTRERAVVEGRGQQPINSATRPSQRNGTRA